MTSSEHFLDLAISVGDYVASKAERVEAGSRWSTLSYFGTPEYSPEVFSGVAGIVLFLADLGRITGGQAYVDLARDGARWIDETMQSSHGGIGRYKGLYSGFSGHGLAMLHAGQAAGDDDLMERALARADALSQTTYGGLELMWGAAGAGIFLLRCFQETGEAHYLDEAARAGAYLLDRAEADGDRLKWLIKLGRSATYQMGMAHGAASIGYFLAELYRFTKDERFRDGALGAARWLQSAAVDTRHGVAWPSHLGDEESPRFQWCHGAPGIGLFFGRTHEIIGDDSCREWALRCGNSTCAAGDIRKNPSQCHGLAGNGELLVELARITGDAEWVAKAREFGCLAAEYGDGDPPNRRWRSDEPDEYSTDFMLGASGLGHFFLRLARPNDVHVPLMVRP